MPYTDDPVTAKDVVGRDLTFGKYPPRYVTLTATLPNIKINLGSIVQVDDYDGVGAAGWINRPLWVLGIQDLLNDMTTAPIVKLTCVDVDRFFSTAGVLGDRDVLGPWTTESAANKAKYFFLSDRTTGAFSDGAPGKGLR
jgi:hypothetical protein